MEKNTPARPVRVALDVMGGDKAPGVNIDGVILAVDVMDGMEVILVGDREVIERELSARSFSHPSVTIHHAEEAILMDEPPTEALRKKRKSSIHEGIKLVKAGEADAFISAGNTGAVMAVAAVILRTIEGIDRAAIAITLPTQTGHTVLLDAGANAVCKPTNLYQFGVMGSIYAEHVLGDNVPRVGLLSIGEEETKGNDLTREAYELLMKSSINFIGNAEAKQLYRGVADVVVCDGFTGNISLKISESAAEFIVKLLKDMFKSGLRGKLAYLLLRPLLDDFKKKIDHSEVGGAPLLGIDGAVFISHGSSCPKAIKSALAAAKKFVKEDVNGHIRESLAKNREILDVKKAKDPETETPGFWDNVKRRIGLVNRPENEETK